MTEVPVDDVVAAAAVVASPVTRGGDNGSGDQSDAGDEQSGDRATTRSAAATAAVAGNGGNGGNGGGRGKGGGRGEKADGRPRDSDDDGDENGTSRRRRRRRREGDDGQGGGDDPQNTVTRVRKPRSAEDEITSLQGSTRLEAKKQRRREGREAGRRRAPIVSEAEFLARREAVDRVMVVRQRDDLTQIAVLEDKVLVEHYVARESQTSLIGNVYLGRVQNVLPSMEAAFIDIGKGRNAVLYAGEVNWSALGHKEGSPRKIESVLSSGQSVLVQVTKDPIGHKGARLTSQVSLAGRFLVYVPDGTTSGISRKLPDTERSRLKALLKEVVPSSAGVIVRTAAEGAAEDELTRDVERLKARWEDIEAKSKGGAPKLLYGEPDLTLKVVRDLFTEDFGKLVIQGDDAWATVHDYVEHMAPDLAERMERYSDDGDVFRAYRIDEQIAKALDRKVWLPSGGSLIIDRTEAMTVVDVNTGKFTGSGGNLEETVTKNNLEAAEEVVRQLRLRDIGGIIVVDFIDMVLESNRDLVLRRMVECLGPRPDPAPGRRGHLARPGADDPQADRHRPARGLQRELLALPGPRPRGPRHAGRARQGRRRAAPRRWSQARRRWRRWPWPRPLGTTTAATTARAGRSAAPKAPSPKDVAAMAKPPRPDADHTDERDQRPGPGPGDQEQRPGADRVRARAGDPAGRRGPGQQPGRGARARDRPGRGAGPPVAEEPDQRAGGAGAGTGGRTGRRAGPRAGPGPGVHGTRASSPAPGAAPAAPPAPRWARQRPGRTDPGADHARHTRHARPGHRLVGAGRRDLRDGSRAAQGGHPDPRPQRQPAGRTAGRRRRPGRLPTGPGEPSSRTPVRWSTCR